MVLKKGKKMAVWAQERGSFFSVVGEQSPGHPSGDGTDSLAAPPGPGGERADTETQQNTSHFLPEARNQHFHLNGLFWEAGEQEVCTLNRSQTAFSAQMSMAQKPRSTGRKPQKYSPSPSLSKPNFPPPRRGRCIEKETALAINTDWNECDLQNRCSGLGGERKKTREGEK